MCVGTGVHGCAYTCFFHVCSHVTKCLCFYRHMCVLSLLYVYKCAFVHMHACDCTHLSGHVCASFECVDVSKFSHVSVCTWLCNSFHLLVMSMGEVKMRTRV